MDRDTSADTPTEAAPPAAKLPPVDDLPPLAPQPTPTPAAASSAKPTPTDQAPAEQPESSGEQGRGTSKPRGSGGRPTGTRAKDTGTGEPKPATLKPDATITRIPVRVPGELYEQALPLVKGIGKPSWGQLVSWTCADHRGDVVATIVANARAEARRPRGQGVVGTAGNQVTARLYANELAPLDAVQKEATGKIDRKVTRTMAVLAALEIATRASTSQAS